MVNNLNIQPPTADNPSDEERKIQVTQSLYDLSEVQQAIREHGRLYLLTSKCRRDVEIKLGWSTDDVAELVLQLGENNYRNSEWCNADVPKWLACDVYIICRSEFNERTNQYLTCEYYLKFAVGPDGTALLFVSCHV